MFSICPVEKRAASPHGGSLPQKQRQNVGVPRERGSHPHALAAPGARGTESTLGRPESPRLPQFRSPRATPASPLPCACSGGRGPVNLHFHVILIVLSVIRVSHLFLFYFALIFFLFRETVYILVFLQQGGLLSMES